MNISDQLKYHNYVFEIETVVKPKAMYLFTVYCTFSIWLVVTTHKVLHDYNFTFMLSMYTNIRFAFYLINVIYFLATCTYTQ